MIAFNNESQNETTWQDNFRRNAPRDRAKTPPRLLSLGIEAREDAIAEGIAHCFLAYVRLHEQGRAEVANCLEPGLVWLTSG